MTELPIFPLRRVDPLNPPAELAEFRLQGPAIKAQLHGRPVWLITRFKEVREVLRDDRFEGEPDSTSIGIG
jgi:cytochrome P450